jgi:hypothetical protein
MPKPSSADLDAEALEVLADGVWALTAAGDPNVGAPCWPGRCTTGGPGRDQLRQARRAVLVSGLAAHHAGAGGALGPVPDRARHRPAAVARGALPGRRATDGTRLRPSLCVLHADPVGLGENGIALVRPDGHLAAVLPFAEALPAALGRATGW